MPPSAVVTKFGGGGAGTSEVQVGTSFGIGSSQPVSLAASARPPAKYRVSCSYRDFESNKDEVA